MKGTVLYQIVVSGPYKIFSGKNKYYSKNVYLQKPTQKDIDDFIKKCCNNEPPNNLTDLDDDNIQMSIIELIVN